VEEFESGEVRQSTSEKVSNEAKFRPLTIECHNTSLSCSEDFWGTGYFQGLNYGWNKFHARNQHARVQVTYNCSSPSPQSTDLGTSESLLLYQSK
jgi:hypothetical protein